MHYSEVEHVGLHNNYIIEFGSAANYKAFCFANHDIKIRFN